MPFSTMVGLPSSRKLSSSGPPGSPPRRSALSMKLTFFSFNPQSSALSSSESDSRRSSSSSSSSGTPQPPFRHFFSPREPSVGVGGRRRGASRWRTAWASCRRSRRLRSPRRSRRYRWGCDTSRTFCRNWRVMSSVASICAGTRGARCHPGRRWQHAGRGDMCPCIPVGSLLLPCWPKPGVPASSCDHPLVTMGGMGPQQGWGCMCHHQLGLGTLMSLPGSWGGVMPSPPPPLPPPPPLLWILPVSSKSSGGP